MSSGFMFYENFLNAIDTLPEEEKAKACYEFCRYGITGEMPKDKYIAMFCVGVSASVRKYSGRGGARDGAGRKSKESKEDFDLEENQKNQKNQKIHNEQTKTKTQTETQTITSQDKSCSVVLKKKTKKEISEDVKKLFEKWWSVYPNKKSKPAALEKFNTLLAEKTVTFDELMKGAIGYSDEVDFEKTETKYIKHPTTWLNQGCWADEYKKHSYFTIEGF